MSRRASKKRKQLQAFVDSLHRLWPGAPADFICPLCRQGFSIDDPEGATLAHIIPASAGGQETTFLCRRCNSRAGHSLDVWFGEMLYLADRRLSIFSTRLRHGGVTINNIPIGATIEKKGKEIQVKMYATRTDPRAMALLSEEARTRGIKTMTLKHPLLDKERQINLAILQAAYLTLVNVFGWIPVFQKSLDIVRQQLLNYDAKIIDHNFVGRSPTYLGYTFGLAEVDGRLCFFASFSSFVVFLPVAGDQTFYADLPTSYKDAGIGATPFMSQHRSTDTSCALVLKERMILWADSIPLEPSSTLQLAFLSAPNATPKFTHPVTIESLTSPPEGEFIDIKIRQ